MEKNTKRMYRELPSGLGLPWWLSSKESACNAGAVDLIPGLGRSYRGEQSNPLHYSPRENPMDRGAQWATFHGVAEPDTTEVTYHALSVSTFGLFVS